MAPVKKPFHSRSKHFLKAWRKFRSITQEKLAELSEISRASVSKIENGVVPYNQDYIERLAEVFKCEPGDLLMHDPNEPPKIPIFDLPQEDAQRVHEFINALRLSRDQALRDQAKTIVSHPIKKQKNLSK